MTWSFRPSRRRAPPRNALSRSFQALEDRTLPAAGLGQLWLLQVDGLTGPGPQQLQEIQRRIDATGEAATAVRYLGLDGLALVETATEQTYAAVDLALHGMPGYRNVRPDFLGATPLFDADSSAVPRLVPGEWVVHFDGFTGTPAAQEELLREYFDADGIQVNLLTQLGEDGVFAVNTAPDETFAQFDAVLRSLPGYSDLEANTVGWVASFAATDPAVLPETPAEPGQWLAQFDGVTGYRLDQIAQIQSMLDAAGTGATVIDQLGSDGLVLIRVDPARSYEDVNTALQAVPDYRDIEPNFIVSADSQPKAAVLATGADAGGGLHVKVFAADGTVLTSFFAYDPSFTGGVRVATGDVNGDGVDDVVTAAGPGGGPHIKVFDGAALLHGVVRELRSFFAYDAAFAGGVNIAVADVTGDGRADIITAPGAGGVPEVKVFDGVTGALDGSFLAYDASFLGGVSVAAGLVNGDAANSNIVTGAGPGGGPHVKVFSGLTGRAIQSFMAYDAGFRGGVNVAVGYLAGNARADIVTGAGPGGGPHVKIFDGFLKAEVRGFMAGDPASRAGVRVATADLTGDGVSEIVTAPGAGDRPRVSVYDGATEKAALGLTAYDPAFRGGVSVAGLAPTDAAGAVTRSFDFRSGDAQGWTGGFAEGPDGQAGIEPLPAELGAGSGFAVSGVNTSDDLFMFLKRELTAADGVLPNQTYRLRFNIEFGSNIPHGLAGVGGSPGDDVVIAAGGGAEEPLVVPSAPVSRLSVDKGHYLKYLGVIANDLPIPDSLNNLPYAPVMRTGTMDFAAHSDANGNLWLLVGTDSSFESLTKLYYLNVTVTLIPLDTV